MSGKRLGTLNDGRKVYSDSPRPLIAALELGHGKLHDGEEDNNGYAFGLTDHHDDRGPQQEPQDVDDHHVGEFYDGAGGDVKETNRRLVVTPGSAITAHRIEWWERDLVIKDAINLIAAREGQGKSTVAASWAARETRDGGVVLWIGTEESRSHAQVPRLIAAGADMDRVMFVDLEVAEGVSGALRFPLDLPLIEKLIVEYDVTMIVLDPCKGTVPFDFQGNDDVAVRQYLEPLADTCHRCCVTLIGLVHFGKRDSRDPGKLILGSVAWSQVARSVISIAEDPDSGNRVLTNGKCNYSPHPRSIEFRIVPQTVNTAEGPSELGAVEWIGDTTKDARDLLGESRRNDDGEEFDERDYTDDSRRAGSTGTWPTRAANEEDVRPKDAVALGADKGISRRTVFRLFDKLANAGMARSIDGTGFPRVAYWRLVVDETTGTTGPCTESGDTTGTTGLDLPRARDAPPPGPGRRQDRQPGTTHRLSSSRSTGSGSLLLPEPVGGPRRHGPASHHQPPGGAVLHVGERENRWDS